MQHSEVERVVARLWAETLAAGGDTADAADLARDPIQAARLVNRINKRLGSRLRVDELFAARTVERLSARVAAQLADGGPRGGPAPARGPYPLSRTQDTFWEFALRGLPITSSFALHLRGEFARDALARSLALVVERHEMLRARFALEDGVARQYVEDRVTVPFDEIDLRGEADPEAAARARMAADQALLFDVAVAPLARCALFRLAAGESILYLSAHHLIADGGAVAVVMREWARLHDALVTARPVEPVRPAARYADYAWEQAHPAGDDAQERAKERYWRATLAPPPDPIPYPSDTPRDGTWQPGLCATARCALSRELLRDLGRLTGTVGAAPYPALLAGFGVLLHRASGATDMVVASVRANRRPADANVVGTFMTSSVLRLDLTGDPTLAELTGRAARRMFEAEVNALPYGPLTELLQRDAQPTAHFRQVVMNFLPSIPLEQSWGPGLTSMTLDLSSMQDRYLPSELCLFTREAHDALSASLYAMKRTFGPQRAAALVRAYEDVLTAMAARPGDRLSEAARGTP